MFSQVLNKAKGIFSKNNLPPTIIDDSSSATVQELQSNLTASHVGTPPQTTSGSESAVNGKRKTRESNTDSDDSSKRRRISSSGLEDGIIEELTSPRRVPKDNVTVEILATKETRAGNEVETTEDNQTASSTLSHTQATNHIRFGSEEPALPIRTAKEIEIHEPAAPEEDSESDDDEAPEVVDNSAQLLSLKAQAQKQKEAKKRDEILQKEKRRLQDEKHKSQAKASVKPKIENLKNPQLPDTKVVQDDDLVSESTATLQGSVVRESGRRALPALLPDEILNAEPFYRTPSPPPEQQRKDTKQHKFFRDVDKPARDLHRGDVTIRVLEDKKHMLPPKSSKAGSRVKAAWIAGQRARHAPGGLKRVGGGPKSFVRR